MNNCGLVDRVKQNVWMVEMAVFMMLYGGIIGYIEKNGLYYEGEIDLNFYTKNVMGLFVITGLVTLYTALKRKTSMVLYLAVLSLTTISAFSRVEAFVLGTVKTSVWSVALVWGQILITQLLFLVHYPSRDSRDAIKEMLEENSEKEE